MKLWHEIKKLSRGISSQWSAGDHRGSPLQTVGDGPCAVPMVKMLLFFQTGIILGEVKLKREHEETAMELTESQKCFFYEEGYLKVSGAVPRAMVDAARQAINAEIGR